MDAAIINPARQPLVVYKALLLFLLWWHLSSSHRKVLLYIRLIQVKSYSYERPYYSKIFYGFLTINFTLWYFYTKLLFPLNFLYPKSTLLYYSKILFTLLYHSNLYYIFKFKSIILFKFILLKFTLHIYTINNK